MSVQNKKIFLPQDKRAWPSADALKWHRKNIYGLFINF
jgi:predicted restriction endonuclease